LDNLERRFILQKRLFNHFRVVKIFLKMLKNYTKPYLQEIAHNVIDEEKESRTGYQDIEVQDGELFDPSYAEWEIAESWERHLKISLSTRLEEDNIENIQKTGKFLATFFVTLEELRKKYNFEKAIPVGVVYKYTEKRNQKFIILADEESGTIHISFFDLNRLLTKPPTKVQAEGTTYSGTLEDFAKLCAAEEFYHIAHPEYEQNILGNVSAGVNLVDYDAQEAEFNALLFQLHNAIEWDMPEHTVENIRQRINRAKKIRDNRIK